MKKELRSGFTTGSCAAACAYASTYMLLSGRELASVSIMTPSGKCYEPDLEQVIWEDNAVTSYVKKDAGDDPDVTRGMPVGVKISRQIPEEIKRRGDFFLTLCDIEGKPLGRRVYIDGGKGVGRVTKEGLEQPVSAAAINRIPRAMIAQEISRAADFFDEDGDFFAQVILPEGERIAAHTFNPRLGIVGGLSVLGTTGIVEPMSEKALIDAIYVEMRQHRGLGEDTIYLAPGNYGQAFLKKNYGYEIDRSVKIANYVGEAIDMAVDLGFSKLLLTGHIGKMIKISGGIMNTHSKMADCRLELLAAAGIRLGLELPLLQDILACPTTDAACELLAHQGKLFVIMEDLMKRMHEYLHHRAQGRLQIELMTYVDAYGCLAKTAGAEDLLLSGASQRREK